MGVWRISVGSSLIVTFALLALTAHTAEFGTRDEAVAMIKRVQEKFKKDGAQATLAAITDQSSQFHDRDLYVYVLDYNCVVQAHGANKTQL